MTPDEKKAQMDARNAAICQFYKEGHKLSECASRFGLGRQRVMQILQAAGAWHPYQKGARTEFLGVTVTPETKQALKAEAERRGVSASQLTSDALEEALRGC